METTTSDNGSPDERPRVSQIFAVIYLGQGRYALDHMNAGAVPRRVAVTRSLRSIQAQLDRLQSPGDVVIISEVLRAMQLLALPCRRLERMQAALGAQQLFDIHGEVGVVPPPGIEPEAVRGSVHVEHPSARAPAPNRIKDILGADETPDSEEAGPGLN